MLTQALEGQRLLAHFPGAKAVHAVCRVNGGSATIIAMICREEDGMWETTLSEEEASQAVAYIVHWPGASAGRVYRQDIGAAESTAM